MIDQPRTGPARVGYQEMGMSELLRTAEGANTVRLGLIFVEDADASSGETLLPPGEAGEFRDLPDLLARSGLSLEALEDLARAVFLTLEDEWGLIPVAVREPR